MNVVYSAVEPARSFWKERKAAAQLAMLPSANLPILPRVRPDLGLQIPVSARLPAVDIHLPLSYANLKSARIPQGWKPADGLILHIQDVHMNAEAQKNIGAAIQEMIDSGKVDLVALEGAFGDIDLFRFRAFEDQDAVRKVADYMLRENKISGPIHVALTGTPHPGPRFIGVDDDALYHSHVQAYKESVPKVEALKKDLALREGGLARQKAVVFGKELLDFDAKVEQHQKGTLALGEYVKLLTSPRPSPMVSIFLMALEMEKSLDFAQVEAERGRMINALVKELSKQQTAQLLNASVSYRAGKIRHTDFYVYLKKLCDENNVLLKNYPAMAAYIRYVLLSDQISPEAFLADLRKMEEASYSALARKPEERELISQSRRLYLEGKLLDFALTPEEWKEYRHSREGGNPSLSSFESFFEHAELRDAALAKNLIQAVHAKKSQVAVLVTGGYHTDGIGNLLKNEKMAVVTLAPKISKLEGKSGTEYLSVFTQEKTPLEKLFDGDKLFLPQEIRVGQITDSAASLALPLAGIDKGILRGEMSHEVLTGRPGFETSWDSDGSNVALVEKRSDGSSISRQMTLTEERDIAQVGREDASGPGFAARGKQLANQIARWAYEQVRAGAGWVKTHPFQAAAAMTFFWFGGKLALSAMGYDVHFGLADGGPLGLAVASMADGVPAAQPAWVSALSVRSAAHEAEGKPNEDAHFIEQYGENIVGGGLFDGAGGQAKGAEASRAASQAVQKMLEMDMDGLSDVSSEDTINEILGILADVMVGGGAALNTIPISAAELGEATERPPVTTATVFTVIKQPDGSHWFAMGNAGNSRAYAFMPNGELVPLTVDNFDPIDEKDKRIVMDMETVRLKVADSPQSWLSKVKKGSDIPAESKDFRGVMRPGEMVFTMRSGVINAFERNVIHHPVLTQGTLPPGSHLVVVSDGIHGNLTDSQIEKILKERGRAPELVAEARKISALSKEDDIRANDDDMTALVVRLGDLPAAPAGGVIRRWERVFMATRAAKLLGFGARPLYRLAIAPWGTEGIWADFLPALFGGTLNLLGTDPMLALAFFSGFRFIMGYLFIETHARGSRGPPALIAAVNIAVSTALFSYGFGPLVIYAANASFHSLVNLYFLLNLPRFMRIFRVVSKRMLIGRNIVTFKNLPRPMEVDLAEVLEAHKAAWRRFGNKVMENLYTIEQFVARVREDRLGVMAAFSNGVIYAVLLSSLVRTGGDPRSIETLSWEDITAPGPRPARENPDTRIFYGIASLSPQGRSIERVANHLIWVTKKLAMRTDKRVRYFYTLSPTIYGRVDAMRDGALKKLEKSGADEKPKLEEQVRRFQKYLAELAALKRLHGITADSTPFEVRKFDIEVGLPFHFAQKYGVEVRRGRKTVKEWRYFDPTYDLHVRSGGAKLAHILPNKLRPDSIYSMIYDYTDVGGRSPGGFKARTPAVIVAVAVVLGVFFMPQDAQAFAHSALQDGGSSYWLAFLGLGGVGVAALADLREWVQDRHQVAVKIRKNLEDFGTDNQTASGKKALIQRWFQWQHDAAEGFLKSPEESGLTEGSRGILARMAHIALNVSAGYQLSKALKALIEFIGLQEGLLNELPGVDAADSGAGFVEMAKREFTELNMPSQDGARKKMTSKMAVAWVFLRQSRESKAPEIMMRDIQYITGLSGASISHHLYEFTREGAVKKNHALLDHGSKSYSADKAGILKKHVVDGESERTQKRNRVTKVDYPASSLTASESADINKLMESGNALLADGYGVASDRRIGEAAKRWRLAQRRFEGVISIGSGHSSTLPARRLLGEVLQLSGEHDRARAVLTQALDMIKHMSDNPPSALFTGSKQALDKIETEWRKMNDLLENPVTPDRAGILNEIKDKRRAEAVKKYGEAKQLAKRAPYQARVEKIKTQLEALVSVRGLTSSRIAALIGERAKISLSHVSINHLLRGHIPRDKSVLDAVETALAVIAAERPEKSFKARAPALVAVTAVALNILVSAQPSLPALGLSLWAVWAAGFSALGLGAVGMVLSLDELSDRFFKKKPVKYVPDGRPYLLMDIGPVIKHHSIFGTLMRGTEVKAMRADTRASDSQQSNMTSLRIFINTGQPVPFEDAPEPELVSRKAVNGSAMALKNAEPGTIKVTSTAPDPYSADGRVQKIARLVKIRNQRDDVKRKSPLTTKELSDFMKSKDPKSEPAEAYPKALSMDWRDFLKAQLKASDIHLNAFAVYYKKDHPYLNRVLNRRQHISDIGRYELVISVGEFIRKKGLEFKPVKSLYGRVHALLRILVIDYGWKFTELSEHTRTRTLSPVGRNLIAGIMRGRKFYARDILLRLAELERLKEDEYLAERRADRKLRFRSSTTLTGLALPTLLMTLPLWREYWPLIAGNLGVPDGVWLMSALLVPAALGMAFAKSRTKVEESRASQRLRSMRYQSLKEIVAGGNLVANAARFMSIQAAVPSLFKPKIKTLDIAVLQKRGNILHRRLERAKTSLSAAEKKVSEREAEVEYAMGRLQFESERVRGIPGLEDTWLPQAVEHAKKGLKDAQAEVTKALKIYQAVQRSKAALDEKIRRLAGGPGDGPAAPPSAPGTRINRKLQGAPLKMNIESLDGSVRNSLKGEAPYVGIVVPPGRNEAEFEAQVTQHLPEGAKVEFFTEKSVKGGLFENGSINFSALDTALGESLRRSGGYTSHSLIVPGSVWGNLTQAQADAFENLKQFKFILINAVLGALPAMALGDILSNEKAALEAVSRSQ